jgi:hypothetical protein
LNALIKNINLFINRILSILKDKFFENDISAFYWSFGVFFIPIILYKIPYWICSKFGFCFFPYLEFSTFVGIWASTIGSFLAFLVMLNINNKKTKTGTDFIQLISNELYTLKKNEEITIITPNINIGSYKYKGESLYEVALKKAIKRGVIIKFITLKLSKVYLSNGLSIEGAEMVTFLKSGSTHDSDQLLYIYDRYIKKYENEEKNEPISWLLRIKSFFSKRPPSAISISSMTIKELYDISSKTNIILKEIDKSKFEDVGLVGFYSMKKLYLGFTEDVQSYKGTVNVVGEVVENPKIIEHYSKFILDLYN